MQKWQLLIRTKWDRDIYTWRKPTTRGFDRCWFCGFSSPESTGKWRSFTPSLSNAEIWHLRAQTGQRAHLVAAASTPRRERIAEE
ncbi:hypothetical protein PanWU01x14_263740 [Parasponia andersonii]|uniref:Uncharacterized protein n=1 Tax=Parasponia andersonii TaxID=3476 RepID=A0A2P5B7L3_PARAD|nr:hypothetical protein PanWU01x14_263740 [Parasponia andersonii]